MTNTLGKQDLAKFVIVGDRVLIKPKKMDGKTSGGLFLPPGVAEKESIHQGYVLKVGPGYAIPSMNEDDFWKEKKNEPKYIPLQTNEGDLAVYLQKASYEIHFNNQQYVIIPQSAILLLIRDDDLFD